MKKLLIIPVLASICLLGGCSLFVQEFDNNEFKLIVDMAVQTEILHESCGDIDAENIKQLQVTSRTFELYTKHTPSNVDVATVATILREDVDQLSRAVSKEYSKIYCDKKTELMLKKINTILPIIPTKRR